MSSAAFRSMKAGTSAIAGFTWRFEKGHVPDREAIFSAMFGAFNQPWPIDDARTHEMTLDGFPVTEIRYSTSADSSRYDKVARLVIDGRSARIVMAYHEVAAGDEENEKRRERVETALGAVHFRKMEEEWSLPAEDLNRRALYCNDAGLSYYTRQDWKTAQRFFKLALMLKHEPAMASNLVDSLIKLGDLQEATKAADQWAAAYPENAQMAEWQGVARERSGNTDGAIEAYQHSIDLGNKKDEVKYALLGLLLDAGRKDEAIARVDSFFKDSSSTMRAVWRAVTYERAGQPDKAVEQLRERLAKPPLDAECAYSLAELFNRLGRYPETEEVLKQLREAGQDSSRVLLIEGWSYMGRKWFPRAKESFQKALEKSPDDQDAKASLEQAASSMGQGGREGADRVIAPVEIPKEFSAQTAPVKQVPSSAKEQDACYLQSVVAYHWVPDQRLTKSMTQRIRILGPSALETFNTLSFTFEGGSERVWMNRLDVTSPDGTKTVSVKPVETWVKDLQDDGLATSRKGFYLPVPGLQVGSTIDLQLTWQDIGTEKEMPLQQRYLANSCSSAAEYVVMTGAVDLISSKISGKGVEEVKGPGVRLWMAKDPIHLHSESLLPDVDRFLPSITIGAKGREWKSLADHYLTELKPLFKPDEEVTARARKLVESISSPSEKVGVIARQIQKDLTYRGIEFGTRARIPSECRKILSDLSGDCKDHALLLVQMLRSCGIPAQLTLVRSSRSVVTELPDFDQFDHMIAYVPGHLPCPWIDLTDKSSAPGEQTPLSLVGRTVLVLDEAGSRLMTLPEAAPLTGWADSVRSVHYQPDGGALVDEKIQFKGSLASWIRSTLRTGSPKEFPKIIQQTIVGVSTVKSCEVSGLEDVRLPLELRISYTVPALLKTSSEGTRSSQSPAAWESCMLGLSSQSERHHPWQLLYGIRFTSEVTIVPPPGAKIPKTIPKTAEGKNGFSVWSTQWRKAEAGEVKMKFEFNGWSHSGPSETHKSLCESWNDALHSLEQPLTW